MFPVPRCRSHTTFVLPRVQPEASRACSVDIIDSGGVLVNVCATQTLLFGFGDTLFILAAGWMCVLGFA